MLFSNVHQGKWGRVHTDSVMVQVCREENGVGPKLLSYSCDEVEELPSLCVYSCVFTQPCVIPAFPAL